MPSKQIWIPFHLVISKRRFGLLHTNTISDRILHCLVYINTLLAMLNSRDILHGRGLNEEESTSSTRKSNPGLSSSSRGSHSGGPVRFNDSKVQSLNISVSQTIDIEHDAVDKIHYEEDNVSVSFSDSLVEPWRLIIYSTPTRKKPVRSCRRTFDHSHRLV